jgi:nucleotide-binding universal stress UspA family protein
MRRQHRDTREGDDMAEIIVGVDGGEPAAAALRWAAQESAWRGEPLVAALAWGYLDQHHPEPDADFDPEYDEGDARAALATYVTTALGEERPDELRTIRDLPGRGLVEAAANASMLVVGARGRGGFKSLLLGSVSHHCVHHAPCPVAVVRTRGISTLVSSDQRIVVGIDGSATSETALRWAVDEAERRGATVDVVYAWQLPFTGPYGFVEPSSDIARYEVDAQHILDRAVEEAQAGRPLSKVLTLGSASSAILSTAEGASLVVVGTRGASGVERFLLGSTASQVVHHAPCPVVVVPPEGTGQ